MNYNIVIIFYSNPSSTHNTQRRKTVTFLETIECPAGHQILTENNSGKQSGTNNIQSNNHGHQGSCNSEVDDFPLPPPPLPIHQNSDRINSSIQNNSDATTNSDSSSVLTSPCLTRNDASNYVESRV